MTPQLCVLEHEPETSLGAFASYLEAAAVDCQLINTTQGALPDADRFDGAIVLGGSLDVYDPRLLETRRWIRNAVLGGLPFLGVCLGGQLLASALGGVVARGRPEVGLHEVFLTDAADHDPLLPGCRAACRSSAATGTASAWRPALSRSRGRSPAPIRPSASAPPPTASSSTQRSAPTTSPAGATSLATSSSPNAPLPISTRLRSGFGARRPHSTSSPGSCSSAGFPSSPPSARRSRRRYERPAARASTTRPPRRETGRPKRRGPGVGEVRFSGLTLLGSPGRVMTPRATSEQLVAAARAHVGAGVARVVDVGTGSGAIAIAVASSCPHAEIWATDTSRSAVLLARSNARRNGLAGRVFVRQGDLLAPVPGPFDVIVANLPYLPASTATDYPELKAEPFDAVFASGDGLERYRRLVDAAPTRLAEGGVLLFQLDRRLVAAGHDELPALRAALAAPSSSARRWDALVEKFAGLAA